MTLNDDNIELYLFRYKEGMLGAAEVAEVEQALVSNPEWKAMADLYDPDLKLPAGVAMEYPAMESLRDGGPKAIPVVEGEREPIVLRDAAPSHRGHLRPVWMSFAAAACLLCFVITVVRFVNSNAITDDGTILSKVTPNAPVTVVSDGDSSTVPQEIQEVAPALRHRAMSNAAASEELPLLASADAESVQGNVVAEPPVAVDTIRYPIGGNTTRELNDPMDQEVLYANIIDWRASGAENSETLSRRQQLRSIARKATSLIATAASGYEESRNEIEDAIEERMQSNSILNNIIATIE